MTGVGNTGVGGGGGGGSSSHGGGGGFGGFLHNLSSDAGSLTGIPMGLVHMAGHEWHDVTHNGWQGAGLGLSQLAAAGLLSWAGAPELVPLVEPAISAGFGHFDHSHNYQSAHDAAAMYHGFVDKGTITGDLGRGRWGAAAHDAYKNPLTSLLTVAAPFTEGAGALGKVGAFAAKGSRAESALGRLAQKAAVLEKAPHGITPEGMVRLRGVTSADGVNLVAKTLKYKTGAGDQIAGGILPRNALLAARKNAVAELRNKIPGDSMLSALSGEAKYSKLFNAPDAAQARHEKAFATRVLGPIAAKLRKSQPESTASYLRNQGFRTKQAVADLAKAITDGAPERKSGVLLSDLTHARIADEVARITDPKVLAHVEAPSKRMLKFEGAARQVEALTNKRMLADGVDTAARRALPLRMVYGAEKAQQMIADMGDAHPIAHSHAPSEMRIGDKVIGRQNATRGANTTLANEQKHNAGIAFMRGLANHDPMQILRAHSNVVDSQASHARALSLLQHLRPVADEKILTPGGMRGMHVADTQTMRHIFEVSHRLEHARAGIEDMPHLSAIADEYKRIVQEHADGKVLAMPQHMHLALGREVASTSKAMKALSKPLAAWKMLQLQYAPRWLVNNGVSQAMLLGVAHPLGGANATLMNALTRGKLHGVALKDAVPEIFGSQGSGFAATQQAAAEAALGGGKLAHPLSALEHGWQPTTKFGKIMHRVVNTATLPLKVGGKISHLNTLISDDIPRQASLRIYAAKAGRALQQQYAASGEHISSSEAVARALADPALCGEIAHKVAGDLIDFSSLSPMEREHITNLVPFWAWLSRMSARTGQIAADEPLKMLALQKLGEVGIASNQQTLGDVPDFVKGVIPLGGVGANGHVGVLKTYGQNPFSTPSDVVGALASPFQQGTPVAGDNPAANLNPFYQAAMEVLTGKSMFTGGDLHSKYRPTTSFLGDNPGDPISQYLHQVGIGVPEGRIYDAFQRQHAYEQAPYNAMYTPSGMDAVYGTMGLPYGDLNVPAAQAKQAKLKYAQMAGA